MTGYDCDIMVVLEEQGSNLVLRPGCQRAVLVLEEGLARGMVSPGIKMAKSVTIAALFMFTLLGQGGATCNIQGVGCKHKGCHGCFLYRQIL